MAELESRTAFAHSVFGADHLHGRPARLIKGSSSRIIYHDHAFATKYLKGATRSFDYDAFDEHFHRHGPLHKPTLVPPKTTFKVIDEDYANVESFLGQALRKNGTLYASDIAEALNMDYLKVREVVARMVKEGKLSVKRS